MDTRQLIIQTLLFIIPAAVVLAASYIVMKKFFENEERKRFYELRMNNHRLTLPIRLQAYERLSLLMERISLNNLILRVKKTGMTASDLQVALLAEIRAEFDHNLSQQIYVSSETWQTISNAKESTIKLINIACSKVPPNATALDLSKVIFELAMKEEAPVSYLALQFLKQDAKELF